MTAKSPSLPVLDRQVGVRVCVVLRVAGLVEEGTPVVDAADRLDHEHDTLWHLDRRAEGARRLLLPLLDVELDVLLRVEIDAEVGKRRLERGEHPVCWEGRVPLGRAEEPRHVPALRLREADANPLAEEPIGRLLEHRLRLLEECAGALGQLVELEPEPSVELRVVRRAELAHCGLLDADRVQLERQQVLLGQRVAGVLEPLALVAVGLVRDRRAEHPVGDLLAVDGHGQVGLDLSGPLLVLTGQVPEVALAREAPELADAAVSVHRGADPVGLVEIGQLGELLVDRLELEGVLQARVVEVVLLVDRGDEAVRLLAVVVQLRLGEDVGHSGVA